MSVAAIEIERVHTLIGKQDQLGTISATILERVFPNQAGGHLVSKLIAVRRASNNPGEIRNLAGRLRIYQGILPDPFNKSRKLNVTRLIATIDRGMYNRET